MVRFDGTGSVQQGVRPAMVFQNNIGNVYSPNVVVIPLTGQIKKTQQMTHVVIKASEAGLNRDSMALCENPTCVPKDNLGRYLTVIPEKYMAKIAEASLLASSAIAYIDPNLLVNIWKKASEMNVTTA